MDSRRGLMRHDEGTATEHEEAPWSERHELVRLLEKHASNPLSFLLLSTGGWRYYWGKTTPGCIGYLEAHRMAVVWGDPICALEDRGALLREFGDAMKTRGVGTCFLAIEEPTAREALSQGSAVLKVGEEPVFDLRSWQRPRGDRGKRLRWSLNKAAKANITICEYRPGDGRDSALEARIRVVQSAWEGSLGRMPTESFLRTAPLAEAERKRIFLAHRGDVLEAVLACAPVYGRDGWYLEDMIRVPEASQGATELLTVTALESLAASGAAFASIGIAALRGSEEQIDRRARWLTWALTLIFHRLDSRFHFASLALYKSKFQPTAWEPRFVSLSSAWPSIRLFRAVLAVLDPDAGSTESRPAGGLPSFGRRLIAYPQAIAGILASLTMLEAHHLSLGQQAAGFIGALLVWVGGVSLRND